MIKRVAHELKPTSRATMPKHVIFFDTETTEHEISPTVKNLTLLLGCGTYARIDKDGSFRIRDTVDFYSTAGFNDWLVGCVKDRQTYYVVAHNIGFDLRITQTLKYLKENGWERRTLIEDGINFIAVYYKGRKKLKFINNQQLFNVSLKSLGESIGEYKAYVDFKLASRGELLEYCRQDVRVMLRAWEIWIAFIRENNLGSFKITAASQSLEAFRHRFMAARVYIHTDERAIRLERASYFGGRTDCFFIGEFRAGPVYSLDINAMYPFVMHEPVPTKLLKHYARTDLRQFAALRQRFGYVAEVTLDICRACLPVKSGIGRLCFPAGRIRGTFTKPELEYALRFGYLLEVHKVNIYSEEALFKDYVSYFYAARQKFKAEGNLAFAYISKLLMNSLYGKFGQRQTEYIKIGTTRSIPDGFYKTAFDTSGRTYKLRIIDGIIERETDPREGYNSFVAIASYITARARVYLDSLIERAGRGNVLYSDTDSLFVTEQGRQRLAGYLNDTEIGKLKQLGVEDSMTIFAPKRYIFGDKSVSKGVRSNATILPGGVVEQDQFMSFRSALRTGNLDGVLIKRIIKRVDSHYTKGNVSPEGWVSPFHSPQFSPDSPSIFLQQ